MRFFYGENFYELSRNVAEISRKFDGEILRVDVSETDMNELFAKLSQTDLFREKKLFVLKNAFQNADFREKFLEISRNIPDENSVILVDEKPDKRTKLYKDLLKIADAKEFKNLSENEVRNWLKTGVISRKMKMDLDAQNELISRKMGNENLQNSVALELEKLANFPEITVEKIREIVDENPTANSFLILENALLRDKKRALFELKILRENGEDANRFLGLLTSQIFAIAAAKFGGDAKKLRINPWQLQNSRSIASKLTEEKLREITKNLAETDVKMKRSSADDAWILVESFLGKI